MRGLHELIAVLVRHDVRFIVVGGMAGVLQGAPVSTYDLDVVYSRDPDNIQRLLDALGSVGATFRNDPQRRRIKPNASHLRSTGHKLLETHHGVLDVLGTIEEHSGYDDLIGDSEELEVSGHRIRVLTLDRLIRIKEQLTRPKDQLMLSILRATLEERRKMGK